MAKYQRIVTTEAGLQLLAAAVVGGTVTFTAIKTGSGTYTGTENLSGATDLKSVRQTFSVSSVTRTGAQVKLRSVLNNDNLAEGYSMTEIGVYAKNPNSGADILYAIIVAELADYLPQYELAPYSITLELYLELTEAESGVTFTAEVIEGAFVPVESFNDHVADNVIHVTAAERSTWNAKLTTTGNVSNTTAAFTESTTLAALATGSKLSVLFGALAKAVSSLISHLSNKSNPHSVTKAQVGLGNVDNTSDANKPISTATQTELDKKALAVDLTSHTGNAGNPHSVTKTQVGLGNVPNVATNDQTPSYTPATTLTALATGEKLSVAFGKLAKAVSSLISHLADSVSHITAAERTAWNAKLDAIATAVNADTVDGYHANQLAKTGTTMPMTIYGYTNDFGIDQTRVYNGTLDDIVNAMPNGSVLHTVIYRPHFPNIGIPSGASEFLELYILQIEVLQAYVKVTDNYYGHEYHSVRYNSTTCSPLKEKYLLHDGSVAMSGMLKIDMTEPKMRMLNDVGDTAELKFQEDCNLGLSVTDADGSTCSLSLMPSKGNGAMARVVENDTVYKMLHTGNSSQVIISTTAPTDTTVLWIDTTNMKLKIYINGAWTALS